MWGRNPFPFHLSNLILHGINCVLVLKFLTKCIQHEPSRFKKENYTVSCPKCQNYAFWGAVLFSVHPVHVEPLGAVVGRADLIAAFIFLCAFSLVSEKEKSRLSFSWMDATLIAICSVFGTLFKETAISLAVVSIVMDLHMNRRQFSSLKLQPSIIFKYLWILGITGSFVLWRLWLQDGPPVFQPYDNPPAFVETTGAKVIIILFVLLLQQDVKQIISTYSLSFGVFRRLST